jgi:hypothetical protein
VEWDGNAQLRITYWPDQPLPLPRATRVPMQLDPTGTVLLPVFAGGLPVIDANDEELVELNGETYLQLERVDLDDPASILDFVRRYGPLGGWAAYCDLGLEAEQRDEDPFFDQIYRGQLDGDEVLARKARALGKQISGLQLRVVDEDSRLEFVTRTTDELLRHFPPVVETVEEFRFAAWLLLDLKGAWQVVRRGLQPDGSDWLRTPARWQPSVDADRPRRELRPGGLAAAIAGNLLIGAAGFLSDILGRLLSSVSPGLGVRISLPPAGAGRERSASSLDTAEIVPRRRAERLPLYVICALELFNHIVADASYHTCANERCGKQFVNQQGRSAKGQHRSRGVFYCTPACARATAQRKYRRKKAGQKTRAA